MKTPEYIHPRELQIGDRVEVWWNSEHGATVRRFENHFVFFTDPKHNFEVGMTLHPFAPFLLLERTNVNIINPLTKRN